MTKRTKSNIIQLTVLLIAIQFIPIKRENPKIGLAIDCGDNTQVRKIFVNSCYDCHSNETKWPWYSNVAPLSWIIAHDVEEGRKHINFSEWETTNMQKSKAVQIVREIREGNMPIRLYRIFHPNSILSPTEIQVVAEWESQIKGDIRFSDYNPN